MLEDYDTDWNVHVHVENENKGISIMERSTGKDNESSRGSGILETIPCVEVEDDAVVKAPLHKSSVQNELENYSTAGNKDSESSRVELLGTNLVFGKWMVDPHGRAE
jgi:hypothetical protein